MRRGLGSEHPFCDKIQIVITFLFFIVWAIDSLSYITVGFSTVLLCALTFPLLFVGTIFSSVFSFYLIEKSHETVFEQFNGPPKLVDYSVYAWVRHPMYLGILLFCAAFLFINISLVSILIWFAFFVLYDRMATFEERKLIEILGERYIEYQHQVSKWLPGCH